MLGLYHIFFDKFRDIKSYDHLEMGSDSLYPAHAEKDLRDCIGPEMEAELGKLQRQCNRDFLSESPSLHTKSTVKESHVSSKIVPMFTDAVPFYQTYSY